MKNGGVEKIIGQAVTLAKVLIADWNFDTIAVKVRDADFTLVFDKLCADDKNYDVVLRQATSANPQLKTRSALPSATTNTRSSVSMKAIGSG